MSLSKALAGFIVQTRYPDLPEEVVSFTKLCILDWLGSALAGADKPPIAMIDGLVKEWGGAEQATLVTGGKSSIAHAALVNGASSHVVELDDIHKSSIIHAATVVIPAAVAVAEALHKSGEDLIAAIAIGYDVCFRIGEAVSPSHYRYWHNTATCGTFGAAAATAKLLELNEEQIVHALGNAGTQAAGLWEFIEDGAMSKQLHTGKAAMNGLLASCLAQRGLTGPSKILEGERGFFSSMSENPDASRITHCLGQVYKIVENSFKIHASCRHTHPAVDLVLQMVHNHGITKERIARLRVGGYQSVLAITDNPNPDTVYAAKFSAQFCVAMALVRGRAGLTDFTEEALWDPEIRAWMGKVELSLDPKVDRAYPEKWGSTLDIQTTEGKTFRFATEYPKGDPENPVTAEELAMKFHQLAGHIDETRRKAWISQLLNLEHLSDTADFWSERSHVS